MATYAYLAVILQLAVSIVGITAGFILYNKTKAKSTLLISLGYILVIFPILIGYGLNAFNYDQKKIELIFFIAWFSGPITVAGLLIYAIKLKN